MIFSALANNGLEYDSAVGGKNFKVEKNMEALRKKAVEVLEGKRADVIIGFERSAGGRLRPLFVRSAAAAEKLVYEEECRQNLAVYLYKPEVKKMGKPALVAPVGTLRAVLQLAAEHQIAENDLLILGIDEKNQLTEIGSLKEAEQAVAARNLALNERDRQLLDKISAMSLEERWQFWQEELSRCFKCYACRAACPMCYCSRCTVECNQPQWIPAPAHALGNLEWHINRAMHLAGRCVSCGACGEACPAGIPIHLLTIKVAEDVYAEFASRAGTGINNEYALSSFKLDDKESFIR